jgi:hypothetical protein
VMVMLVYHTEITTRHKDKAILYWFGPPESKTLRPVLQFVLLRSQVGLHGRGVDGGGLRVVAQEGALARLILGDGQGRWTGVQVGYNRETYL